MNRTQLMLGGLLLVQLVLILIFHSPFSDATTTQPRPLIPELAALTPGQLEIQGPDDARLMLVKRGEEWQVDDLGGFPADSQKVETMIEELEMLEVRRPVVSSGRYHSAFKVDGDENEARIRLWEDASGDPAVDLIVGSAPNFRSSHVRRADEDDVYEVRGLSAYDVRPDVSNWIEREFVDVDDLRVLGLTLTNAAGSFELAKQDGVWTLVSPALSGGEQLDQGKIYSLVRSVASLRVSDATGAVDVSHGFENPVATLVLRWGPDLIEQDAGGGELTLLVGAQVADDEEQRYVTREGFGFTGEVGQYSVIRLIEDTVNELLGS